MTTGDIILQSPVNKLTGENPPYHILLTLQAKGGEAKLPISRAVGCEELGGDFAVGTNYANTTPCLFHIILSKSQFNDM
jgi:hypothetical protein